MIPGLAAARAHRVGLVAIGTNYLAQALLAIGNAREAIERLTEVTAAERVGERGDAWHANNLALLGFARVAYEDEQSALDLLSVAWAETKRSWLANLVPIVGNLYAESLIRMSARSPELLDQANQILSTCAEEVELSRMLRSKIKTLSLRSEYWWLQGDPSESRQASSDAIRLLKDKNWQMPALRAEDVLIQHAKILARVGNVREAREYALRARREKQKKLKTLPVQYANHWDTELVNREIERVCGDLGLDGS